jgi:hypothetical protein
MLSDPLSRERLDAIRGHATISQDPDLLELLAERDRLDAVYGEALSQRDHWRWEAQRRLSVREELAALLGTEDIEEAVREVAQLRAEVARLQEVRQRGCDCSDEDACRFARERDEARADVARLEHDRTAAQECAQRTQADGNLLADRLFAQEARHRAAIDGWRQVCIDHGITPDAGSLRCALRRLADHACVGACEGRCGQ